MLPDEILIQQVTQGQSDALGVLYERYGRIIFSSAVKIIQDAQRAEELVQEVFLRIWQNASSYESSRGRVLTWALTITHNACIDELRRRKARPQRAEAKADQDEMIDPLLSIADTGAAANIEEVVWCHEVGAAVHQALQDLPPEQRAVLEMAYFQGLTHREISEQLGLPLGTAKTRMLLGMKKMRQILDIQGFNPLK